MKILILTDEQWAGLRSALTPEQRKLLLPGKPNGKLPGAVELNQMARNGDEPPAFTRLREEQEAVNDAQDQIRERMHALISEADAVGVKPGALAAWSGYTPRRVHQIARGI